MPSESETSVAEPILEASRRAIEQAGAAAPPPWCPFFAELAQRLFDPELRIDLLRRTHGVQGGFYTEGFRTIFGHAPKAFLTRARIAAAAHLLRATDLAISTIASLVGIPARSTFETAFNHIEGFPPGAVRTGRDLTRRLCQTSSDDATLDALARCFALETDATIAARRLRELRRALPSARDHRPEPRGELERLAAPALWLCARELPPETWRRSLAAPLSLVTPEQFEKLCRESREAGEADPQRQLAIAELALENLLALRRRLGEKRFSKLEARWREQTGRSPGRSDP